jgi:putative glutamine amidotransferase
LVATAWTADGLVEALEDPRGDRFALAVQWHPEIAWEQDEFSQSIFGRFVSAARDYAAGRRAGRVGEVNYGRG